MYRVTKDVYTCIVHVVKQFNPLLHETFYVTKVHIHVICR